ncbi:hypothetical protein CSX04_07517 [Burkholderia cepacia]|nr:hypothetical protein CSX04_07517 [Burkholderia cepacia]
MEVDNEVTELSVELNPVDNELMPVDVDVDNDVIALLADDTPVDNELTLDAVDVDRELTAWFVASSCDPLIASVLAELMRPAATLVIWRSVPAAPTLTTLVGLVPLKL